VSNVFDDSKNGFLKFVREGRKEAEILRYLTAIDSPRNHTISGATIWPVSGGDVIFMPMAGCWLTSVKNPDAHLWSIVEQLFEAVDFLHQHGVAHLDLKPGNILIPVDGGRLSIIDFNISVRVNGPKHKFCGVVGTPGYIPPEVKADRGPFSAVRADLWSCGRTLYELCNLCRPSLDRNALLEIAGELMNEDPEKRPMMSDVLERMAYRKIDDSGSGCQRYCVIFWVKAPIDLFCCKGWPIARSILIMRGNVFYVGCEHLLSYSGQIFLCWPTADLCMSGHRTYTTHYVLLLLFSSSIPTGICNTSAKSLSGILLLKGTLSRSPRP